jgi:hypothetical protein
MTQSYITQTQTGHRAGAHIQLTWAADHDERYERLIMIGESSIDEHTSLRYCMQAYRHP